MSSRKASSGIRVTSVSYKPAAKVFHLANGRFLTMHRYCCLGPGDYVSTKHKTEAYVICTNGRAQLLPTYRAVDTVRVGKRTLRLTVKELESEIEIQGYHQLEEYHYRGKVLHGRRIPLIVCCSDPLLPPVLGYIELATAFIMNRPRAVVLDDNFVDPLSSVSWSNWKKDTVRRYTNLIVRIARTVVSPEFRGLGLSRILVRHAARFARHHWHVGRLVPLFLEITADMLRYVPFVEAAGMHYIGDTEGNLSRVRTDMDYILRNYSRVTSREILKEETAGIVDLQVQYAAALHRIEEEQGISRDRLLSLLRRSPHRLADDDWALLHRIFRLPKPTFLLGLTPVAERFLKRRLRELGLPTRFPTNNPHARAPAIKEPIAIRGCTLRLESPLIRTRATRRIQQAFGVSRDMLSTTLFSNLSLTIQPGDIVLICGPSGAGKTTLLSLLRSRLSNDRTDFRGLTGSVDVPGGLTSSTLGPLSNARPLINSLGKAKLEEALFALNVSGLAEAHLYVKRFRELSNGQRYRAMVAKLIASGADVWLADEFCSALDPITANIVSRNLHRCAKHLGVTAILAAASWSEFIHELQPDTVVHLRSPWDVRVFRWSEFACALENSQVSYRPLRSAGLAKG